MKNDIHTDEPSVFVGYCRGGIASINYLAQQDAQSEYIRAMVIEGTPVNPVEAYHTKLGNFGVPKHVSEKIFRMLWSGYSVDEPTTIDIIKNIKNKDLPILIVHSKDDTNFPFSNALKLYREFKQQGFSHVHIAPLKGQHAWGLRDDKENYLKAVHSFYKFYQLPYDIIYATENAQNYLYDLEQAKKDIEKQDSDVNKLIKDAQRKIITSVGIVLRGSDNTCLDTYPANYIL